MPRKKKLQTYVSDELYKHLERSARKSKTSVSLEAARLLEAALGLCNSPKQLQSPYPSVLCDPELIEELQNLSDRIERLENDKVTYARPDPSRRGRKGSGGR